MSVIAPASSSTARGDRGRGADHQDRRDPHGGQDEQHDDDRVPGMAEAGDQVAGQRAGGGGADARQPQRELDRVVHQGLGWVRNGPTQTATTATATSANRVAARQPSRPASRANATAQGRPGGGLHPGGQPQRQAGPDDRVPRPRGQHGEARGTRTRPWARRRPRPTISSATIGLAVTSAVQRQASAAPPMRSAQRRPR